MTTDAPTATNPATTDTDTTEAEKRADAGPMASSQGNGDDLPDAFQPQPIHADYTGFSHVCNSCLEATDAASLYRERNRLRAALIENEQRIRELCATYGNPLPEATLQRNREALQGSDA